MRITTKGQVTIPIEIREEMGFLPDTEVAFRIRDGEVILEKVEEPSGRGRQLVERMRGRATAGLSTDEIMAMTRAE